MTKFYENIFNKFNDWDSYKTLSEYVKNKNITAVFGIDEQKVYFAAKLCSDLNKKALIIVPDDQKMRIINETMQSINGNSLVFPAKDYIFRDIESVSRYDENKRIETLSKIKKNDFSSVIVPADALCSIVMHPDEYKEIVINQQSVIVFDNLISDIMNFGYERYSIVEGPGQFSVRGGIVDIFPPSVEFPIRLEFFGDEVDSISIFDINTQRRMEPLDFARITPAKEHTMSVVDNLKTELKKYQKNQHVKHDLEMLEQGILPRHDRYLPAYYQKTANILDYIDNDTIIFIFDYTSVIEHIKGFCFRINEDIQTLLEDDYTFLNKNYYYELNNILEKLNKPIIFETLPSSLQGLELDKICNFNIFPATISSFKLLKDEITDFLEQDYTIHLLVVDNTQLDEINSEFNIHKNLFISIGSLPFGYVIHELKTIVYAYRPKSEYKPPKKQKFERGERIKSFTDIKPGDYVVHVNYGVGIYDGIHKVDQQGIINDFIKIKFAGTDVLYFPCAQLDLISKYIGSAEDIKVKLNKLGGTDWTRTKQKVKKAVRDLADSLVKLYGERLKSKGFMFSEDTEWQKDFENSFEFTETDDQLKCIYEIKQDMEGITPMDRLLCGDVGFGKTEVALRAVFKCVMDSKQVVILAPTTILAFQHYQTMLKRFNSFPLKVDLLSRFRTPTQQKNIIKRLKRGEIDVIVGTHRVFSKDIEFKDLGLIVVDEEQRFGVAHKEQLKESFKNIDVLTLSATPIPRTLNMSLSGIRDISIINEAPHNRFPITTYVAEYDLGLIIDAIKREVARNGQCYYLHNRVETIYKTASIIASKTNFRVAVAHGQMSQDELANVWETLVLGDIDVLVCTTIIETGVDVPNCNTLIIEDADRLGLAQLHQIRGRVGRTDKRAYAYFTFRKGKVLTQDAYKRLMTIKEYTEFGSGLKIAMRDLEIRGAGDILGAEQHGHLVTVGFDMYMKLLEEAVVEQKGGKKAKSECVVELKLNAYIPDSFISDMQTRIEVYKMIASIRSEDDYRDVLDEIIDRFGEIPNSVLTLLNIAKIRHLASECYIVEIAENDGNILLYTEDSVNFEIISMILSMMKGKVLFSAGTRPYFTLKTITVISDLEHFLGNLKKCIDNFEN